MTVDQFVLLPPARLRRPTPASPVSSSLSADQPRQLQRSLGNRAVEELSAQAEAPDMVASALDIPGGPLNDTVRSEFEHRLGHDLGAVRLHTGTQASAAADAVGAAAFTYGQHVVFAGPYDPDSPHDRGLLAHELAHTIQQGEAPWPGPIRMGEPGAPAEREAGEIVRGAAVPAGPRAGTVAPRIARQPKTGPPVPLQEAELDRIPPKDRDALEKAVVGYIPLAFTAFSNAAQAHAAAIKNEAKAEAEVIAAVVDVLTGFAAPIFANWIVGKLTARAAAIATAATSEVTTKAVVKLISQQDTFKAAFQGATKIANQVMKSNANLLFGETEIDAFALALRNTFQRGAGEILNHVTTITDEQLLATWVAYDPANADETAYRRVLADLFGRYRAQISEIGSTLRASEGPSADTGLYEVQLASGSRLATITAWSSGERNLWAWISPDMVSIARAKAVALGLGAPKIPLRDVQMSLAEIIEPPRPDLRRLDNVDTARRLSPGERSKAADDPDVETVVNQGRQTDGRIANQYERRKTLWVLRGYSSHALACLDELDSWFPNGYVVERQIKAMDSAERARLAADSWFVSRLQAEISPYPLEFVRYALGIGPKPTPPPEIDVPDMYGP